MKTTSALLSFTLLVAFTLLTASLHGNASRRWGQGKLLDSATKKLDAIPAQFGDWELKTRQELPKEVVDILESPGCMMGIYVNKATGETVSAALLVGAPGPISVHTPDICYSSSRYNISDERSSVRIDGTPDGADRFWKLDLQSRGVNAEKLRVFYGWHAGEHWLAPENPRITCATAPVLYKIQVACDLATDAGQDDAGQRFLRDFLKAAKPHLEVAQSGS